MTRQQVPARPDAFEQHRWNDAVTKHGELAGLYPNRMNHDLVNNRLRLTEEAARMLCALDDFDREKVAEELLAITKDPNRPDVPRGRKNFLQRMWRSKYPFRDYHYLIQYSLTEPQQVAVHRILFDKKLLGRQLHNEQLERNALYVVKRGTGAGVKFDSNFRNLGDKPDLVMNRLQSAWQAERPNPVKRVQTRHAAVNGMLNDLQKAAWLMGAHLDTAYPDDDPDRYTLFHNPTEGAEDFLECLYDKLPWHRSGSNNARHLAAILVETQRRGHRTRWVAHSQGGIIFTRAIEEVLRNHPDKLPLDCHSLSLHGTGSNVGKTDEFCRRADIRIDRVRNSPFDLVPNVAGGNNLSFSGLVRSLRFSPRVFGNEPLASPHTLPFISTETYIAQLRFTGHKRLARRAAHYHPSDLRRE